MPALPRVVVLFLAALLCACTVSGNQDRFLEKFADPEPKLSAVVICHSYGCSRSDTLNLSRDWASLTEPLRMPALTPQEERERLSIFIASVEVVVGERLGTSGDIGGTFTGFAQEGQLDCIDEAANTTTFLTLLKDEGLLYWHDVRAPMSRGFFVNGWPHTSAVIADLESGENYVVDSWFHANGHPAEVVELTTWVGGWSPDGSQAEQIVASSAEPADLVSPVRAP